MSSLQERLVFFVETITRGGDKIEQSRKSLEKMGMTQQRVTQYYDKGSKNILGQSDALERLRNKFSESIVSNEDIVRQTSRFRAAMHDLGISVNSNVEFFDAHTNELMKGNKLASRAFHTYNGFRNVMAATNTEFKFALPWIKEHGTRTAKFAARIREATMGIEGFRSEILTLLFFGMALTNWFSSMAKPAMELFGIFELIDITKMLLMEPIMEKLLPLFIGLLEVVDALPRPIKLILGGFILLVGILGSIAVLFSIATFGIGGLIANFGHLSKVITGFSWGAIASFAWIFGLIAAIMILTKIFFDYSESTEYAKQHTSQLSDAWKDYTKHFMDFIRRFIGGTDEMTEGTTTWGMVVAYVGSLITSTFAVIGVVANTLSTIFALAFGTINHIIWTAIDTTFGNLIRAAYHVAKVIAYTFGKDIPASVENAYNSFNELVKNKRDVGLFLDTAKGVLAGGAERQQGFMSAIRNPKDAVRAYESSFTPTSYGASQNMSPVINLDYHPKDAVRAYESSFTPTSYGASQNMSPVINLDYHPNFDLNGAMSSRDIQKMVEDAAKNSTYLLSKELERLYQ
jgi:hypothetical protein